MINSKYKDAMYKTREVANLRDMVNSSAILYKDHTAYLVKDKPGGIYRPITYTEFKSDRDAFGTALLDLDLKNKKVALIGENRYEWIVSYLATVGGVGVIVPLDRELSAEEINNLLNRSQASAVIYSSKLEKLIEDATRGAESVECLIGMDLLDDKEASDGCPEKFSMQKLLDRGARLLKEENRSYLDAEIDAEVMCSLLFTSGTTGLAKGVMLSHKNIISNVINMSKYVHVEGWTGLSVLPMHHTYEFTCHILTAHYQGCSVAICEGLKYIVKNMAESKASVMLSVPLVFENMHKKVWKNAEAKGKDKKMRKALQLSKALGGHNRKSTKKLFKEVHEALGGNMKLFIAGGAAMDPSIIEDFNAFGLPMIQGYGMTENAPIIAVNRDRYSKPASVGPPMPGTDVLIIEKDENGIGEIICKGPSVMLGYYEDQEATDNTIINGWLHTGDFGYLDSDGYLYVTGRKKNIIVTKNGKNISPEEVEYYLQQSPYIEEVVVWGKDEDEKDIIICADIFPDYDYIKEEHGDVEIEEIRKLLKKEIDSSNEKMPIYKRVKRFFVRQDPFEKTTSMKIKRHTIRR